jgi:hypothetical protein
LVLLLRALVGDALAATDLGERGQHGVAGQAGVAQHPGRLARDLQEGQEQVLGGDVLVRQAGGLGERLLQDLPGRGREVQLLLRAVHLGDTCQRLLGPVAKDPRGLAEPLEHRIDHAVGIGQEGIQHVSRFDQLVVPVTGQLLSGPQGLL